MERQELQKISKSEIQSQKRISHYFNLDIFKILFY